MIIDLDKYSPKKVEGFTFESVVDGDIRQEMSVIRAYGFSNNTIAITVKTTNVGESRVYLDANSIGKLVQALQLIQEIVQKDNN